MSENAPSAKETGQFFKNSTLYREFLAERDEILRHKWIESEKAGRDIGFEQALTDWNLKHLSKWRRSRNTEQRKGEAGR